MASSLPLFDFLDSELELRDREDWDELARSRDPYGDLYLDEDDLLPAPTELWEEIGPDSEPFDYDQLGRIMLRGHVRLDTCGIGDNWDGYEHEDIDPWLDEPIQIGRILFVDGMPESDEELGFEPILPRYKMMAGILGRENGQDGLKRSDTRERHDVRSGKGQTHHRKVWARPIEHRSSEEHVA